MAPPDRNSEITRAFVIGGLIGAAAGILLAAKGGRETLEVILKRTEDFLTRIQGDYEKAAEKVNRAYDILNRCREGLPNSDRKT